MVDIPVTVSTPGAVKGAGEIRNFGTAVGGAADANTKFLASTKAVTAALPNETNELKKAAAAAKDYARAISASSFDKFGSSSNSRISQLQKESTVLAKRQMLLSDIARRAAADQAGLGSSTPQSGGLLKRIGRGIAAGGAAVGAGGPLGSLLAVGSLGTAAIAAASGMIVLGASLTILNGLMALNIERSKALAEAHNKEISIRREAAATLGRQGVAAADTQGDALLKLLGLGGQDLVNRANAIGKANGLKPADAQEGVAIAEQIKNPVLRDRAMQAGVSLARGGRSSFADAMKTIVGDGLSGFGDPDQIAAAALSSMTDQMVRAKDVRAMNGNIASSSLAGSILDTRTAQAAGAEIGQGQIRFAPASVMTANAAAADPLAAARSEDYRIRQEQLDVLRAIDDGQTKLYALFDRIWSPWANARNNRIRAENLDAEISQQASD